MKDRDSHSNPSVSNPRHSSATRRKLHVVFEDEARPSELAERNEEDEEEQKDNGIYSSNNKKKKSGNSKRKGAEMKNGEGGRDVEENTVSNSGSSGVRLTTATTLSLSPAGAAATSFSPVPSASPTQLPSTILLSPPISGSNTLDTSFSLFSRKYTNQSKDDGREERPLHPTCAHSSYGGAGGGENKKKIQNSSSAAGSPPPRLLQSSSSARLSPSSPFMDNTDFTSATDDAFSTEEYVFKVAVVGSFHVGKTALIHRFQEVARLSSNFSTFPSSITTTTTKKMANFSPSDQKSKTSSGGGGAGTASVTRPTPNTTSTHYHNNNNDHTPPSSCMLTNLLPLPLSKPTIGTDFFSCEINNLVPSVHIRLQLWDTAGLARYAAPLSTVFRSASLVLCIFDATNVPSLQAIVQQYIPSIVEGLPGAEPRQIFIVANKMDLVSSDDTSASSGGGGKRKKEAENKEEDRSTVDEEENREPSFSSPSSLGKKFFDKSSSTVSPLHFSSSLPPALSSSDHRDTSALLQEQQYFNTHPGAAFLQFRQQTSSSSSSERTGDDAFNPTLPPPHPSLHGTQNIKQCEKKNRSDEIGINEDDDDSSQGVNHNRNNHRNNSVNSSRRSSTSSTNGRHRVLPSSAEGKREKNTGITPQRGVRREQHVDPVSSFSSSSSLPPQFVSRELVEKSVLSEFPGIHYAEVSALSGVGICSLLSRMCFTMLESEGALDLRDEEEEGEGEQGVKREGVESMGANQLPTTSKKPMNSPAAAPAGGEVGAGGPTGKGGEEQSGRTKPAGRGWTGGGESSPPAISFSMRQAGMGIEDIGGLAYLNADFSTGPGIKMDEAEDGGGRDTKKKRSISAKGTPSLFSPKDGGGPRGSDGSAGGAGGNNKKNISTAGSALARLRGTVEGKSNKNDDDHDDDDGDGEDLYNEILKETSGNILECGGGRGREMDQADAILREAQQENKKRRAGVRALHTGLIPEEEGEGEEKAKNRGFTETNEEEDEDKIREDLEAEISQRLAAFQQEEREGGSNGGKNGGQTRGGGSHSPNNNNSAQDRSGKGASTSGVTMDIAAHYKKEREAKRKEREAQKKKKGCC